MGRYTERPIISADQFIYKGLGYNTQINYNFPRRKWTLAARFSSLIPHREVRIAAGYKQQQQTTLAATYHLNGYKLKAQAEASTSATTSPVRWMST